MCLNKAMSKSEFAISGVILILSKKWSFYNLTIYIIQQYHWNNLDFITTSSSSLHSFTSSLIFYHTFLHVHLFTLYIFHFNSSFVTRVHFIIRISLSIWEAAITVIGLLYHLVVMKSSSKYLIEQQISFKASPTFKFKRQPYLSLLETNLRS